MTNHTFRILNGTSPTYLRVGIQKFQNVHGHNTRSESMAIFKPRMGTHGQRTFLYQSISLWNSLPNTIQSQQCKDIFKKEVKSHFIDVLLKNERDVFNYTYFIQAGPGFFWCYILSFIIFISKNCII